MKIEMRSLDSIKPFENNPRKNDSAVEAVGKSIQEFGFKQPIVVDTENVIVVGHTRWKAAQKIGLSQPTWAATFEAFRSRCAPQSGFPTGGPRERVDRKCHAGERRAVAAEAAEVGERTLYVLAPSTLASTATRIGPASLPMRVPATGCDQCPTSTSELRSLSCSCHTCAMLVGRRAAATARRSPQHAWIARGMRVLWRVDR